MPRPPPPPMAFTITPAPRCASKKARASSSVTADWLPGISGTPQRSARARAAALSPNRRK